MRITYFIISLVITLALIIILDKPIGSVPPIGQFVSPQHGFWQNAEPTNKNFSASLDFPQLNNIVNVYFDERMVPHIFAEDENDAWFVQGYLHAKFRLWQMEFQTHAAAGRLSEILGAGPDSAYLNNDRNMRRVGMVYGAERTLAEIEKDSLTGRQINAYTAGVNNYIEQLSVADLPLEYRLLNYKPERWSNLKTALFLKYMSYDLTGYETDIEYTNAKSFFSEADFNKLYPLINDSSSPVVPRGTEFSPPLIKTVIPTNADSLYYLWKDTLNIIADKTDKNNGSNNWVAGGSKTKSGRPILCNDPHLGLNLPSLWYEMQIHTPSFNVYGVSCPGAPSIIIGFNENIAWGVTNAARDVRDYYAIEFRDASKRHYRFNNEWKNTKLKTEKYILKDGSVFTDTVAYTIFGPVMYDDHYNGNGRLKNNKSLAVRWKAHDPSNELKTFALLDRATNYGEYEVALSYFVCPGQNFAFASKTGDIALWQQGSFPAKWNRQGDFIMPGADSSYMWQGDIPQQENLRDINNARGFVSSANQIPADTTYPYYMGGHYDLYRGLQINRYLSGMNNITPKDMQKLQNNNFNPFADEALPFLLSHIKENELNGDEKRYLETVRSWNRINDNEEKGPSIFVSWTEWLQQLVWDDELSQTGGSFERPEDFTTLQILKNDSAFISIDNITTPQKESLEDIVTASFKAAAKALVNTEKENRLAWNKFKDAGIRHLLRIEPFSRYHLNTGGGYHIINATKQFHGPSWKMIVHLTDDIEAYGIYPGGQSGNAGSRYYDPFVNDWAAGKYYSLWMMKKEDVQSPKIRYTLKFNKG
jgi:penicillin G amidase